MTPEQFTYWLQGFIELNGGQYPSPEQWKMITEHLNTVFTKVTPPLGPGLTGPVKPLFPFYPAVPSPTITPDWTQPSVICSTLYSDKPTVAIC